MLCTLSTISAPILPPFDYKPQTDDEPEEEITEKTRKYPSPLLQWHYYRKPLIADAKMQYAFDSSGKRYLDGFAAKTSIPCGHAHPDLVNLSTTYSHHWIANYAEALVSKMPGNLKVVAFVNSIGEANALAVMMARLYSGNEEMVALRNSYLCKSGHMLQGIFHGVNNPDPYRGTFGSDASRYADDLQHHITYARSGSVAGFMAETIQGIEGTVEMAPGYLKLAYDIVRNAGGVCIADEVETGFGRLGSHFWGFETQGVIPDIVTISKGIGGGLLGAVVTTPEITGVVSQKLRFNNYSGNPTYAAAGHAVLRVLEKENRQAHCLEVGSHLIDRLKTLQETHDIIGDVRGRGLLVGIELVNDRKEKTPAKVETEVLSEKLRECGLLVHKGGIHGNVIRARPPMCFSKADADFFVDALDYAISKL